MRRPEFRQLVAEEFPEAPWISKLIRPLNEVLGQIAVGLANGLSVGENLNAQVKVLDVTGGRFPVSFQCSVRGKAVGAWVARCVEVVGREEKPVSFAAFPSWDVDGSSFILRGVTGLVDGTAYRLTLTVIGG